MYAALSSVIIGLKFHFPTVLLSAINLETFSELVAFVFIQSLRNLIAIFFIFKGESFRFVVGRIWMKSGSCILLILNRFFFRLVLVLSRHGGGWEKVGVQNRCEEGKKIGMFGGWGYLVKCS